MLILVRFFNFPKLTQMLTGVVRNTQLKFRQKISLRFEEPVIFKICRKSIKTHVL